MIRTGNVRVHVHHSAISRLTAPGGMVYEHAVDVRNTAITIMRATAPVRTGALRASIRNGGALKTGPNSMSAQARILAKHARWVLEGTGIYGPKGMPIVPNPRTHFVRSRWGGWEERPRRLAIRSATGVVIARPYSVRGQRPNDFVTRALRQAMRQHGYA